MYAYNDDPRVKGSRRGQRWITIVTNQLTNISVVYVCTITKYFYHGLGQKTRKLALFISTATGDQQ
jgi:hypothetical protein